MRARYVGDPRHDGDGPATIQYFDRQWRKGEWQALDECPARLRGNWHFECEDDDAMPEGFEPQGAIEVTPADPFDHDGDGSPGGSLPASEDPDAAEKAEIRAELDLLGAKQPHHATGIAKLRLARDAAREQAAFLAGED